MYPADYHYTKQHEWVKIDGVTGIRQIDEGNIIHPTDANGLVEPEARVFAPALVKELSPTIGQRRPD